MQVLGRGVAFALMHGEGGLGAAVLDAVLGKTLLAVLRNALDIGKLVLDVSEVDAGALLACANVGVLLDSSGVRRVLGDGHFDLGQGLVLEEHPVHEAVQRSHLLEVLVVNLRASRRVDTHIVALAEELEQGFSEDVLVLYLR